MWALVPLGSCHMVLSRNLVKHTPFIPFFYLFWYLRNENIGSFAFQTMGHLVETNPWTFADRGDWHCHQDGATDVKSKMRPKNTEMFVLYMVSYSWFNGGMSKTKRMECEPMQVLAWSFKIQEVSSLFLAVDWWSRGGHTIYLVQWCSRENHPKWSTKKNQHKCP